MVAKLLQDGDQITVTAVGNKTAGDREVWTDGVGIWLEDTTSGEDGAVAIEGVFRVPKNAAALNLFAVGDPVYADGSGNATITPGIKIGMATAAAATGDTEVDVKLGVGAHV